MEILVFVVLALLIVVYLARHKESFASSDVEHHWSQEFIRQWQQNRKIDALGETRATVCRMLRIPQRIEGDVALDYISELLGIDPSMGQHYFIIEWQKFWNPVRDKNYAKYLRLSWDPRHNPVSGELIQLFGIDPSTNAREAIAKIYENLGLRRSASKSQFKRVLKKYRQNRIQAWQDRFAEEWDNPTGQFAEVKPVYKTVFGLDSGWDGIQVLKNLHQIVDVPFTTATPEQLTRRLQQRISEYQRENKKRDLTDMTRPTYICRQDNKRLVCTDPSGKNPVIVASHKNSGVKPAKYVCKRRGDRYSCTEVDDELYEGIAGGHAAPHNPPFTRGLVTSFTRGLVKGSRVSEGATQWQGSEATHRNSTSKRRHADASKSQAPAALKRSKVQSLRSCSKAGGLWGERSGPAACPPAGGLWGDKVPPPPFEVNVDGVDYKCRYRPKYANYVCQCNTRILKNTGSSLVDELVNHAGGLKNTNLHNLLL